MENRADAHLSTALLLLTTAIYVGILAALFAGMAVTKPSNAQALMDWAKDYGSIIAGLPVIVAIFVAKQQLDAARAQHEATIKLEFKDDLDGLQVASEVASSLRGPKYLSSFIFFKKRKINQSEVDAVAKCGSPAVITAFADLKAVVNDGAKLKREPDLLNFMFPHRSLIDDDQSKAAKAVLKAVEDRKKFLRQFLPSLI